MIHELDKSEYGRTYSLFKKLDYNLIIRAVIEGTSPGRVYVDDVNQPKTAFLCSVEGYYLAGNVNNDAFNNSLNKLIFETFLLETP